ncbi:MAG: hypothetical protein ACW98Y_04925 [Candidatus Thorarchaeota archaeon]|jgi:hypothetical protein
MRKVIAKIVSNSLGFVGLQETPYGYIDVVAKDGEQLHIKIDVQTFHESLEPGYEVEIEMEYLGGTEILVAKTVYILGELKSEKETAETAA